MNDFSKIFGGMFARDFGGETSKPEDSKTIPTAKKVERKPVDFQSHAADRGAGGNDNIPGKTKTNLITVLKNNKLQEKSGETVIATINVANEHILDICLDNNGLPIVACHGGAFDGYYVLYNGFCFGPYSEKITHLTPISTFPFSFKVRKGRWAFVKEDGVKIGTSEPVAHGPNGQFAYVIGINNDFYVVDRYTERGPYQYAWNLQFSPEGSLVCSIMYDNQVYLYYDGTEIGPYDFIDYFWFSDDEKLVYKTKENDRAYIYYDNERIGPYDSIESLRFSPTGRLFFEAEKYGTRYLYYNGEEYDGYDSVHDISFTDNGTIVYTARQGDSWYFCKGYNEVGPFDNVRLFDTSEESLMGNGEVFAYQIGEEWYIRDTYNNNQFGPFEYVFDIVASPNKELLFHVGLDGGECFFYGQQKSRLFERLQICKRWFEITGEIIYSYKKFNAGYYVFNGKYEIPTAGELSKFAVSHDGSRFAFTIQEQRRSDVYAIDGNEKIGPFERINSLSFSDDDSTLFMSVEVDGQLYEYYGDMQYGPFDRKIRIYNIFPSTDGKLLSYAFEENKQQYSRIFIDGNMYPGKLYNGKALYVNDGKIILRT